MSRWCDREVGDEVAARIGAAVRVRRARRPVAQEALTAGERRQWHALAPGPRRQDWLTGRAALKALLPATADTSTMSFPHRNLSLTHSCGVAVAVGIEADADDDHSVVAGAGVDHEPWRSTDPRMARFFLHPHERSTPLGLLRAWTVKEALYKAVVANHRSTLLDIVLDDAAVTTGTATGPGGERLRYTVLDTAEGPLGVALCLEDRRVAV
ncbi:MAG: 4'-phosphopantetheinyl transferase superfamily protein [Actinobacteria bacterium]|nr:4'-phosphopantetheinyl transferase superfamily protein [Actinomycetota bacterium]